MGLAIVAIIRAIVAITGSIVTIGHALRRVPDLAISWKQGGCDFVEAKEGEGERAGGSGGLASSWRQWSGALMEAVVLRVRGGSGPASSWKRRSGEFVEAAAQRLRGSGGLAVILNCSSCEQGGFRRPKKYLGCISHPGQKAGCMSHPGQKAGCMSHPGPFRL